MQMNTRNKIYFWMLKNTNITIKQTRETPAIYSSEKQLLCYDLLGFLVYKFWDPSTLYWGSHYHKCNSEVSHFLLAECSACQQLFCMKNSFSAQLSIPSCSDRLRRKLFISSLSNLAWHCWKTTSFNNNLKHFIRGVLKVFEFKF